MNAVAWAPHTYGLVLAAASADGFVTVYTHNKDTSQWDKKSWLAHKGGCTSLSWGTEVKSSTAGGQTQSLRAGKRLVTGGCDKLIRLWRFEENERAWREQADAWGDSNAHGHWVRDVAWAPSIGTPTSSIASCSEDRKVVIWNEDMSGVWRKSKEIGFDQKVWRVSWSVMGNILAVSQGDNRVSLWKETVNGDWVNLSTMGEQESKESKEKKERDA